MISDLCKDKTDGYVFDIQGLSVHDGPGCRTTVFLKGCSLDCFWCSNPEGISRKPIPMYFVSKCILCNSCISSCDSNAIRVDNRKLVFSNELCLNCNSHSCVLECYTDALKLSGYRITLKELMRIIQRDRKFWGDVGGVTLSGGEPLLQISFAKEILRCCHDQYIHTAIETCGNIPFRNFEQVIPYLDWIFFDLKHLDPDIHISGTSADNSLIIENARRLAKEFKGRLMFRMPLIPNFNDSDGNIKSTISFLKEIGIKEINVLPLHHLGREKYLSINKEYRGTDYPIPLNDDLLQIKKTFSDSMIDCYIGSDTPF
jgi:glycyl-radical enzyme activating protein